MHPELMRTITADHIKDLIAAAARWRQGRQARLVLAAGQHARAARAGAIVMTVRGRA